MSELERFKENVRLEQLKYQPTAKEKIFASKFCNILIKQMDSLINGICQSRLDK